MVSENKEIEQAFKTWAIENKLYWLPSGPIYDAFCAGIEYQKEIKHDEYGKGYNAGYEQGLVEGNLNCQHR